MAKMLQAYRVYGPRVDANRTAQLDTVAEWMAMRTGLNKSEVLMVLQEIGDAVVYFNAQGTPVKLPAVGTFTPGIDRHGTFKVNFRADQALKNQLNAADAFTGEIKNQGNIGIDDDAYRALWDADHPDDPIEI
jgi:nucleoid DNA-binding protein